MRNIYKNHTNQSLLAALLALGVHTAAQAEDSETASRFSLNGFGTVGMTRSSSNGAGFVRDLSQPHGSKGEWSANVDSLIGLQANWVLNDQLAVIAQGISRYHIGSSYDPELMWGCLLYTSRCV